MEKVCVLAALPKDSLIQTKDLIVGPQREAMKAAVRSENAALDRMSGGPANQEAIAAFRKSARLTFPTCKPSKNLDAKSTP